MKFFIAAILLISINISAFGAEKIVTLHVPGMNCAMCPITVKKALQKVEGVLSVNVSYKTKLGVVRFDDSKIDADALLEATTNAGYPSILFDGEKFE